MKIIYIVISALLILFILGMEYYKISIKEGITNINYDFYDNNTTNRNMSNDENISINGNINIDGNSFLNSNIDYANTIIYGNITVDGNTLVCNNIVVYGNSLICNDNFIDGNIQHIYAQTIMGNDNIVYGNYLADQYDIYSSYHDNANVASYDTLFHDTIDDIKSQTNTYDLNMDKIKILNDKGEEIEIYVSKTQGNATYYHPGTYRYGGFTWVPNYEESIYLSSKYGVNPNRIVNPQNFIPYDEGTFLNKSYQPANVETTTIKTRDV